MHRLVFGCLLEVEMELLPEGMDRKLSGKLGEKFEHDL